MEKNNIRRRRRPVSVEAVEYFCYAHVQLHHTWDQLADSRLLSGTYVRCLFFCIFMVQCFRLNVVC
jgi:hypothetical protein